VCGVGCRVWGVGCRVQGAGFRILGFRVQGSGFDPHAQVALAVAARDLVLGFGC